MSLRTRLESFDEWLNSLSGEPLHPLRSVPQEGLLARVTLAGCVRGSSATRVGRVEQRAGMRARSRFVHRPPLSIHYQKLEESINECPEYILYYSIREL